ncbi:MAG TPA: hypothetical protein VMW27_20460 [Thermoanaerobaculia bacterium]|nr:hypothetical protein [Thermoanaerobaculia bacterium]
MKLRAVRRIVAGLALVAALIVVSPMSSEAAGFGQGTLTSLWSLGWDRLASVGEKLGWTAPVESRRVPTRPRARRDGAPARVWDKQGSMVDPNGCQGSPSTSTCAGGETQATPKT